MTENRCDLYKMIIECSHVIHYFIDNEGTLVYISPSCENITGYDKESFLHNPDMLTDIIHPEDRERFQDHLKIVYDVADHSEMEFRIISRGGQVRWIKHHCSPLFDEHGEYLGRRGSNIDITRQKEIQENLLDREKDLEMLFNNSTDGFFYMMIDEPIVWDHTVDKDEVLEYVLDHQRITKINQSMLDQYGAKEESFIGTTVRELYAHDLEQGKAVWREFFDQGVLYVETQEQKFSGEPMDIEGEYLCIYDEEGRITGHFGIQRDVTERKRAQEELKRLNRRLVEEMSKASKIHNRLFPDTLPKMNGLEIQTFFQAAQHLGGDFYDLIKVGDELFVLMVDVSGHGLDGAMIATFIKSCFLNWIATKEKPFSLSEGLRFVGQQFKQMGYPDDYFACLFLGIVHPKKKTFSYASTGFHTTLFINNKEGLQESILGGLPISGAIDLSNNNLKEHKVNLDEGDMIFISTDGIIEAENDNSMYEQKLKEIIKKNGEKSPEELRSNLISDFKSFIGGKELHDDVTFLILKFV